MDQYLAWAVGVGVVAFIWVCFFNVTARGQRRKRTDETTGGGTSGELYDPYGGEGGGFGGYSGAGDGGYGGGYGGGDGGDDGCGGD